MFFWLNRELNIVCIWVSMVRVNRKLNIPISKMYYHQFDKANFSYAVLVNLLFRGLGVCFLIPSKNNCCFVCMYHMTHRNNCVSIWDSDSMRNFVIQSLCIGKIAATNFCIIVCREWFWNSCILSLSVCLCVYMCLYVFCVEKFKRWYQFVSLSETRNWYTK